MNIFNKPKIWLGFLPLFLMFALTLKMGFNTSAKELMTLADTTYFKSWYLTDDMDEGRHEDTLTFKAGAGRKSWVKIPFEKA